MQYEYDFELDPADRDRLDWRRQHLRDVVPALKEAAEGEEPLPDVSSLEDAS